LILDDKSLNFRFLWKDLEIAKGKEERSCKAVR
jgi:hypothetical protein